MTSASDPLKELRENVEFLEELSHIDPVEKIIVGNGLKRLVAKSITIEEFEARSTELVRRYRDKNDGLSLAEIENWGETA